MVGQNFAFIHYPRKIMDPNITATNNLPKLGVIITIAELTDIFKLKPRLLSCKGHLLRPVLALLLMNVLVESLKTRVFLKIRFQEKQI